MPWTPFDLLTCHCAIEQMRSYEPAEHDETKSVAPLLQFFELVHVGDTMQSMIQVYFDKELVCHFSNTRVYRVTHIFGNRHPISTERIS